jgi:hypothetical protein
LTGSLVDTLMAASYQFENIDQADIELADQAERWLRGHGWETHYLRGWSSRDRSFAAPGRDDEPHALIVRGRISNRIWEAAGERYPVANFRRALNTLAILEIIPERYTTIGRDALNDHATVCERAARVLKDDMGTGANRCTAQERLLVYARAEGLAEAARSARGHYPLAVPA